jgi:hypothetical protein
VDSSRSSLVIIESVQRPVTNGENNTYGAEVGITQFSTKGSLELMIGSVTSEGLKQQLNNFAERLAASTRAVNASRTPPPLTCIKTSRNSTNLRQSKDSAT